MSSDDPLCMRDLNPSLLNAQIESKSKDKLRAPSEFQIAKEQRLQQKEQRLNKLPSTKAHSTPTKADIPPPPEIVDPSTLLDKISAYRERFPHLKSRNSKLTAKSTIEELTDELHYLELQLGSQKDGNIGNYLFIGALTTLERVSYSYNPLNLQLQGLGKVAGDNIDEFSPIIDELLIKYGTGMYMPPEYRLILATGALVYTVHSANCGNPKFAEAYASMKKKVNVPSGSSDL